MEQIELKDFITSILVDVAAGIKNANAELIDPAKGQHEVFQSAA